MRRILLTGGTGFVGSHTCLELLMNNFQVVLLDSFINSSSLCLKRIENVCKLKGIDIENKVHFVKGDMRDQNVINKIFMEANYIGNPINAVVHFAGLKSISQSVIFPLDYWENNLISSINLLRAMDKNNCRNLIFSSSASIYQCKKIKLLNEKDKINPINPYSNTKYAIETLFHDVLKSSPKNWRILNLRYFNPIGAHDSGLIGEEPIGNPNNIFPIILDIAAGIKSKLKIFGKDWPTSDGTGVRDYIHIMDLAAGHVSALEYLFSSKYKIVNLNLGTGRASSVLNLVNCFEKVNNIKIPYEFTDRRKGDFSTLIADNKLALSILNWEPKRSLEQMCRDGWKWKKNNFL